MSLPQTETTPKWMVWTGRVISALPVLMLIMSGLTKFHLGEENTANTIKMGWDPNIMPALGVVEIGSALLYVIPQTAVLGAILLTGYLGGAVATHVRLADWPHAPIAFVLGILVWVGLYLRDHRVRSLAPIRNLNS
jgi:hypothetical protein